MRLDSHYPLVLYILEAFGVRPCRRSSTGFRKSIPGPRRGAQLDVRIRDSFLPRCAARIAAMRRHRSVMVGLSVTTHRAWGAVPVLTTLQQIRSGMFQLMGRSILHPLRSRMRLSRSIMEAARRNRNPQNLDYPISLPSPSTKNLQNCTQRSFAPQGLRRSSVRPWRPLCRFGRAPEEG